MEQAFVDKVCVKCPHYVAVGNGIKGGLRKQSCFYERDVQSIEERQFSKGFKAGKQISKLEVCPDPKTSEKLALIQGNVKSVTR